MGCRRSARAGIRFLRLDKTGLVNTWEGIVSYEENQRGIHLFYNPLLRKCHSPSSK